MNLVTSSSSAHRRAVVLMICATTLWSMAGVVTRHLSLPLQLQGRFEITFWRSFFAALFIAGFLLLIKREGFTALRRAGWPGVLSGAMWGVMYSAFMLALTLTTTANTLLVMSLGPLLTALLARLVLAATIAPRTWVAIVVAMLGMGLMFLLGTDSTHVAQGSHVLGMVVAFAVPLASAVNLVTLQKTRATVDLIPAVLIGGLLSAAVMLATLAASHALPFKATGTDLLLLALLGFFQLGLPCMLMVMAARYLSAPEIALLSLLEVVLGTLWAWLGAGEVPAPATLYGGSLVLSALVLNELAAMYQRSKQRTR